VNTVYYVGQEYPDIFARKDLTVDFELPAFASRASLRYIVTGHGGHSEGDEFTKQRNLVSVDGTPVLDFIPLAHGLFVIPPFQSHVRHLVPPQRAAGRHAAGRTPSAAEPR
jgi:hypothetical protein